MDNQWSTICTVRDIDLNVSGCCRRQSWCCYHRRLICQWRIGYRLSDTSSPLPWTLSSGDRSSWLTSLDLRHVQCYSKLKENILCNDLPKRSELCRYGWHLVKNLYALELWLTLPWQLKSPSQKIEYKKNLTGNKPSLNQNLGRFVAYDIIKFTK